MLKRVPMPTKRQREAKPETRWKSPAHRDHVRAHACSICGETAAIEVMHVRIGSGAGMGQKPDDWRTISGCRDCHDRQHRVGEGTFWQGLDVEGLIEDFIRTSPRRQEIERVRSQRNVR